MKKFIVMVCAALCLLTGCRNVQLETVTDVWTPEPLPDAKEIILVLPDEISVPAMEQEQETLYLCDKYILTTHITKSGDINGTILSATGFDVEKLNPIVTQSDGFKRYDCVWVAAGEHGDQICRVAILDDGFYHYVLQAETEHSVAGKLQETWQDIFDSFTIRDTAA